MSIRPSPRRWFIPLLVIEAILAAPVASGFPVREEAAATVTVLTGVSFHTGPSSEIHIGFSKNMSFSSISISSAKADFGTLEIGGYSNATVTVTVTNWTCPNVCRLTAAVSAAPGTNARVNVTGSQVHFYVDTVDKTNTLTISGTTASALWSSWATTHTFFWIFGLAGQPAPTINGQDPMAFMWNYLVIFAVLITFTLVLYGAWYFKGRKGGA